MKTFKLPADITLVDRLTGEAGQTVTFQQFLTLGLMVDGRFSNSYAALKKSQRIEKAFDSVAPGDSVKLDTADWELLRDVASAPSNGQYGAFSSLAMCQLVPFIDAIVGASES